MYRVLVTGVGGPAGMAVLQSLRVAPERIKLFGVDMNPLSPGFLISDERSLVPRCTSPEYVPSLLELCARWKIKLVIPTVDEEVPILAHHRHAFEEKRVSVPIPYEKTAELARDKLKIARFSRQGIDVPRTFAFGDSASIRRAIKVLGLPCVMKQRSGRGGRGFAIIESLDDALHIRHKRGKERLILQQKIDGDLLLAQGVASKGRLLVSIIHRRLAVKNEGSGTATAAVTVKDSMATAHLRDLVKILDWTGAIGVEFIRDSHSSRRYMIDINPRICGQSHLSAMAGVNLAYGLVQLSRGEKVTVGPSYKTGLAFVRVWRDEVLKFSELGSMRRRTKRGTESAK